MIDQHAAPRLGIYLHWPFCVQKCSYCAFASTVDRELQESYLEALVGEIRAAGRIYGGEVDTVFIGGGTPSSAPRNFIATILDEIRNAFHVLPSAEISAEANPESFTADTVTEWRTAGVTRVSLGLQAVQPGHLFRLGRVHTLQDFEAAFRRAREGGFDNINVDLMYGLPHQTAGEWKQTLRFVRKLAPEHISCYALSLEEGTPLRERVAGGLLPVPDEALEAKMYTLASHMLGSGGYEHYEISNFSRPGRQCRHNVKYWSLENYLGLGAAAHSMIGLFRLVNSSSVTQYIDERSDGRLHYAGVDFTSPMERVNEFVMLRTRLQQGFAEEEYSRMFGREFREMHSDGIARCLDEGLIELKEGRVQPTQKGFLFQNRLALHLMMSG